MHLRPFKKLISIYLAFLEEKGNSTVIASLL